MSSQARELTGTTLAALDRLTEREKDCLRRWLQHQTAKEMAIDLGISPHAVEKRLKMARAKLGVSTSLDAARLLEASERYDQTGPQPPDLDNAVSQSKSRLSRKVVFGAIAMSLIGVTVLATLMHSTGPASDIPMIPKPGEILVVGPVSFEALDKDDSGFLEGQETPMIVRFGGDPTYERQADGRIDLSGEYVEVSGSDELRDRFYAEADTDRDGKVSPDEFKRWATPKIARNGTSTEETSAD